MSSASSLQESSLEVHLEDGRLMLDEMPQTRVEEQVLALSGEEAYRAAYKAHHANTLNHVS